MDHQVRSCLFRVIERNSLKRGMQVVFLHGMQYGTVNFSFSFDGLELPLGGPGGGVDDNVRRCH